MCKKKQGPVCMYVLVGALLIGVFLGPWLFTQPCLFGWKSLDFTRTGDIGDTIGGITAPFIGLISIVLLIWTLREQIRINDKQIEFNESSRITTLQQIIMQKDDHIRFAYSTKFSTVNGKGCVCLSLLRQDPSSGVGITFNEICKVVKEVHALELTISCLVSFIEKSHLLEEEKRIAMIGTFDYIEEIQSFYRMITNDQIQIIPPASDVWDNELGIKGGKEELKYSAKKYSISFQKTKTVTDNYIVS